MDKQKRAQWLDAFERATELPLLILALAIIPLLVLPFFADLSEGTERTLIATDWIIWAIFAVELSIRTYLSERRIQYLLRHWYDVLIVVLPFLRPLRILRSARAMRLLRLSRLLPFIVRTAILTRRLLQRRGLQYVMLTGLVAIFGSAALMWWLESTNGGTIDDYGTALWWASVTVTTVGYGDTFPISAEGRGVAIFLMLTGITFFSWLTANIAAFFIEHVEEDDDKARPVTLQDLMAKMETLEREIQALSGQSKQKALEG